MVIVRIQGGLGNQLFQYAFGEYISSKYGLQVKYDAKLNLDNGKFTSRSLSIEELGFKLPMASKDELKKELYLTSNVLSYRIKRKVLQKCRFLKSSYSVQNADPHTIDFDLQRDNIYYDGYWQNNQIVLEVLPFFKNLINQKKINLPHVIDYSNAASIHIRRGDYINIKQNKSIFSILDLEYFKKGIAYLKEKHFVSKFYIFSDDIEWVKQNFEGSQYYFIDGNSVINDFLMMSNFKYNIISNSTFSTWAAYLSGFENNIVVYPATWYTQEKLNESISKLVLKRWISI